MEDLEKIMSMARKLKALAERGDAGEKIAATSKYLEYLRKHNLSDSDINPEMNKRSIAVNDGDEMDILLNVILSINPYTKHNDIKTHLECYLDQEDYEEVLVKFEYFRKLFKMERELLITAFLAKHHDPFFEPDERANKKWRERRVENDSLITKVKEKEIIDEEFFKIQTDLDAGISMGTMANKVMQSGDRLKVAAFNKSRKQQMADVLLDADYSSVKGRKRLNSR